ncbi:MAG: CPBP family intramembrane metalloprotease [Planctomycetes bacterium]|nr:CPBP family intramembrane metalloprotease [Planctomycetota bacterium]
MMKQDTTLALSPMAWWAALLHIVAALLVILLFLIAIKFITGSFLLSVLGTPLALLPITLLLRRRGESWALLGFRKPQRWLKAIVQGVVIAVVVLVVLIGLQYTLEPLFKTRDKSSLGEVRGSFWLYLYWVGVVSWLVQGLGEELIFRGFIMTRLAQMFRLNGTAWGAAVLVQGVLFGLMHSHLGVEGMISTAAAGVVFGIGYLMTGRNLLPCVIAHSLCGTLLISMIYFGNS